MQIDGAQGGSQLTRVYTRSGGITTGGTAQKLLPSRVAYPSVEASARGYFLFNNTSSANLYLELGPARATAVLSGTTISSISITNAGMSYTYPPTVVFLGGGGPPGAVSGGAGFPVPGANGTTGTVATAAASVSGGSISAISLTSPGSGYLAAPDVFLAWDPRDPWGSASPSAASGFVIYPGGQFVCESSVFPSDSVAVFGATTGQTFQYGYIV